MTQLKIPITQISPVATSAGRTEFDPGVHCVRKPPCVDHDLHLAYKGSGFVIIDGVEFYMEKGDAITIFPGEVFSVKSTGTIPFGRYYLHFDFFDDPELRRETPFLPDGSMWPRMLRIPEDVNARALCAELCLCGLEDGEMSYADKMIADGKLLSLLGLVLSTYNTSLLNKNEDNFKSRRNILRAQRYIIENYSNSLTLEDLAGVANLSASYFGNVFKSLVGKSPIDYLIDRRISEAKRLMLETDLKINEIARRVGYDDLYYFSYLFKRREGITPSEFIANCFKID